MRAGLRIAASRGAEAAKSSVLGPTPGVAKSTRRRPSGLRTGLAGGVKVSIRTGRENKAGVVSGEGVRVTTTDTKLPPEKSPMVKAYMSREFRHPVFGRDAYVSQKGKDWFYRPLFAGRDEYQRAIVKAIEAASEAIGKK